MSLGHPLWTTSHLPLALYPSFLRFLMFLLPPIFTAMMLCQNSRGQVTDWTLNPERKQDHIFWVKSLVTTMKTLTTQAPSVCYQCFRVQSHTEGNILPSTFIQPLLITIFEISVNITAFCLFSHWENTIWCQMWWHTSVTVALRKLRQENQKLQTSQR